MDNFKSICEFDQADWYNYQWQLHHQITAREQLEKCIILTEKEKQFFNSSKKFPFAITPYILSIIDKDNINCPIRKQFIPTINELDTYDIESNDSLHEHEQMPVPGIVHRYKNRCLFITTLYCSSYCRFCTRSWIVGKDKLLTNDLYKKQLDYIREHTEIVDVILSGGDFLLLPNDKIEYVLAELKNISHVRFIRIGTRVPIVLPMRITDELVSIIKKYSPIWMNIHINHPNEFTKDSIYAINKIVDYGIVCSSQTVLLKGVNDCPNIIKELTYKCLENRVRPYYLFQCDVVPNAQHFITPIATGISIMEYLRGNCSGLCNLSYIVDSYNGKIPVNPNYVLSSSNDNVILRSYQGKIVKYPNKNNLIHHDKLNCDYCKNHIYQDSISDML